ncbi:hypothetical protein GGQ80_001687 [Sphingomonas jinjuensis]|uniref:Ice-binding protein C-terminal domain-containing protein n=1 Tax=Sphingomonas jinjuensis TaxID=535907 RepID=A0A840FAW5_9SPHN|nr:PEPxxWA-CTERM sorting domain-containing protein [Sphingomonas jinjuensis]MBB4153781.1 hypothetical protein [Sphingomonas jinjuensis]
MKFSTLIAISVAVMCSAPASAASAADVFNGVMEDSSLFKGSFKLEGRLGNYTLSAFSTTYKGMSFNLMNTGLEQVGERVLIGGKPNGVSSTTTGTDDFYLAYFNPAQVGFTKPVATNAMIAMEGMREQAYFPITVSRAASRVIDPVPEPATWAMMLVGFGMIGAAARYRRRSSAAAAA